MVGTLRFTVAWALALAWVLAILGCGGGDGGDDGGVAPDSKAPTITLATPADGDTVRGLVVIGADASDENGVSQVEFYVDGNLEALDNSPSWAVVWDCSDTTNLTYHDINAVAFDPSDNAGYSDTITVFVRNPIGPSLQVSSDSLDFDSTLVSLPLEIHNIGGDVVIWEIEVGVAWASPDRSVGVTADQPDVVNVTVDRSGRSPGHYVGLLRVTSNAGEADVGLAMDIISEVTEPDLCVTSAGLAFDSTLTEITFDIENCGTGELSWAVSVDSLWADVSPSSGTTTTEVDTVTVTVDRRSRAAGHYTGMVTVTSGGGDSTVAISMDVPALTTRSGQIGEDEAWFGDVLITGDVTVNAGATLIVAPGSRVRLAAQSDDQGAGTAAGLCELTVRGTLEARGTAEAPIVFTSSAASPAPGDWQWIYVSGECELEHCQVSYGAHGVRSEQARPVLETCRIGDCLNNGIWASGYSDLEVTGTSVHDCGVNGIRLVTSSGVFEGDSVYRCGDNGLLLESTSSPVVRDLYTADNSGAGIYLYAHSRPSISGCHVEANGDDGIFAQWDCSAEVESCLVSGNGGSGVYLTDQCKGSVRATEISGNDYYGVILKGLNSTVFTGNTIVSNLNYGVYCSQGATPNFGDLSSGEASDDGGNRIYDNDGYEFYNDTAGDLRAENNWWGVADSLAIEALIWDGTDNASLGRVDFEPYRTSP
jgi:hypothetical protein